MYRLNIFTHTHIYTPTYILYSCVLAANVKFTIWSYSRVQTHKYKKCVNSLKWTIWKRFYFFKGSYWPWSINIPISSERFLDILKKKTLLSRIIFHRLVEVHVVWSFCSKMHCQNITTLWHHNFCTLFHKKERERKNI